MNRYPQSEASDALVLIAACNRMLRSHLAPGYQTQRHTLSTPPKMSIGSITAPPQCKLGECASVSSLNLSGITGNHDGDSNPAAPSLLLRVSPHLVPLMLGLLVRGIPAFQIHKTHDRGYFFFLRKNFDYKARTSTAYAKWVPQSLTN